jgi:hypothetical protein
MADGMQRIKDQALIVACGLGLASIADDLLGMGADLNADGCAAMLRAAEGRHGAVLAVLLDARMKSRLVLCPKMDDLVHHLDLVLVLACEAGVSDSVRAMLKHGADPRAFGGLAMARAAHAGFLDAVQVLVSAGVRMRPGD